MRIKILFPFLLVLLLVSACIVLFSLPSFIVFLGTATAILPTTPASTTSAVTLTDTPAAAATVATAAAATITFTPAFIPTSTSTFIPTSTPTSVPASTLTLAPTFIPTRTQPPTVPPTLPPSGGSSSCLTMNYAYESQVINLVNNERANANNGLSSLSFNGSISNSAEAWSVYLATSNSFYHSSSFPAGGGENIAAGYDTPADVVAAWMNSEGHRANILNSSYTQVGAGYAYCTGSTYGSYWTLQFGP